MSYIENTRGYYTASKLKKLRQCPELFKKLYVTEELKEISEEMDDEDSLIVGTLFHKFREEMPDGDNREEIIKEKCYVTNEYLKDDFITKILERYKIHLIQEGREDAEISIILDSHLKRLKSSKTLLSDLQTEWYGDVQRAKMQKNIGITRTQFAKLLGMMESTMKQKLRDFGGKYTRESTLSVTYDPKETEGSIELGAKPDRFVFIRYADGKEVERYTEEEYAAMIEGMTRGEKEKFAKSNKIKALLRDFKSIKPGGIAGIKKELQYNHETNYGYVFSMGFYYTIIYVKYGVQSDVRIDFVETAKPFITEVITIPVSFLHDKMVQDIIPTMKYAIDCEKTGEYPAVSREDILASTELRKYYQYMDNVQQIEPYKIDLVL